MRFTFHSSNDPLLVEMALCREGMRLLSDPALALAVERAADKVKSEVVAGRDRNEVIVEVSSALVAHLLDMLRDDYDDKAMAAAALSLASVSVVSYMMLTPEERQREDEETRALMARFAGKNPLQMPAPGSMN